MPWGGAPSRRLEFPDTSSFHPLQKSPAVAVAGAESRVGLEGFQFSSQPLTVHTAICSRSISGLPCGENRQAFARDRESLVIPCSPHYLNRGHRSALIRSTRSNGTGTAHRRPRTKCLRLIVQIAIFRRSSEPWLPPNSSSTSWSLPLPPLMVSSPPVPSEIQNERQRSTGGISLVSMVRVVAFVRREKHRNL